MQKITPIKAIAVALIMVLVLNLILFTFKKINSMVFWGVMIAAALLAWKVVPKYKKNRKINYSYDKAAKLFYCILR